MPHVLIDHAFFQLPAGQSREKRTAAGQPSRNQTEMPSCRRPSKKICPKKDFRQIPQGCSYEYSRKLFRKE